MLCFSRAPYLPNIIESRANKQLKCLQRREWEVRRSCCR